jgi:hypothetical protein
MSEEDPKTTGKAQNLRYTQIITYHTIGKSGVRAIAILRIDFRTTLCKPTERRKIIIYAHLATGNMAEIGSNQSDAPYIFGDSTVSWRQNVGRLVQKEYVMQSTTAKYAKSLYVLNRQRCTWWYTSGRRHLLFNHSKPDQKTGS